MSKIFTYSVLSFLQSNNMINEFIYLKTFQNAHHKRDTM